MTFNLYKVHVFFTGFVLKRQTVEPVISVGCCVVTEDYVML